MAQKFKGNAGASAVPTKGNAAMNMMNAERLYRVEKKGVIRNES